MRTYLLPIACLLCLFSSKIAAQSFLFGNDLSYVNEMEDCGVVYKENGQPADPYQLFADHNCGIVRLRLWHTPTWYDNLNAGHRYSDLADVRRSIIRAKAANMQVLLDFHLSDNWADPQKQQVPAAWEGVVNNLPLLKDSLYNYVKGTLLSLHADGLLPNMVQIGNETNKGILLSPQVDAAGWSLDWPRNAALFKRAIEAVRDVESQTGQAIKVALHVAGPADTGWLMQGFWNNGVKDFDVIGMSYYWAWHQPTDIADAGNVVAQLKQTYPGKEVMIFETGYIWTNQSNDSANNIISQTHPSYAPASPENQRKWLVDMTQEVINRGASAVFYWEPAWVSSTCWTQWGQGSHQEHATFFDFNTNLLPTGGMGWMEHAYSGINAVKEATNSFSFEAIPDSSHRSVRLRFSGLESNKPLTINLLDGQGRLVASQKMNAMSDATLNLPDLGTGVYYIAAFADGKMLGAKKLWLGGR
ncbi:MAG: glycosyl hydrolase 53 family protein [Saprospiraceae bacterium]|nr:glycosyl hydrolase 53 family protein [Saprospiraceae bacterium]